MANPKAYRAVIDEIIGLIKKYKFDVIVAPESRGF
jgi:adenine/guanine phosphoribosyltransferase-like PRPP-binding protein